ncbi:MAG: tetratricopeptide repeat protein [Deferribacteraceae bacterium]|nr:tetratricopeptide repeat protein [Deferribacteraceae bacterium]
MSKNFLLISLICCVLALVGCKKERQTVGDEITENSSIVSVIEVNDPEISAGNEAFLKGDFQSAINYYESGLKQNRSIAYYNMGVSYYLDLNIAEAEKYFKLAVAEDPTFDEAIMNLVAVLAEQEKSVEAETYATRLVGTRKTARVFVDVANLAIKNGSSAKAAYYYEKALQLDAKSSFVLSNYANFLISIGELEKGQKILESLPEKDFTALYNLAYIAWMQGNTGTSYNYAMQAAEDPDDSEEGLNKLATLLHELKRYTHEAETLRKLILWSPKKDYRLRLVYSYMHAWELDKATDEINQFRREYPTDINAIVSLYNILIAQGKITDAGNFILAEFQKNPDDMLRYQVVRHKSLYDRDFKDAKALISVPQKTPLVELARVAYYTSIRELKTAAKILATIPESTDNDYYIYQSFLLFKDKKLNEATAVAGKIEPTKPEYFWYHLVFSWNLHKPESILELVHEYRANHITSVRVPMLRYYLNPVREDMEFASQFDGKGSDIATTLLYPFFIEPDDMYPFVALGYKFIRAEDDTAAIGELEYSIERSNAVAKHNEGLKKLLNFNYAGALADFREAEKVLNLDPFLQYNVGLIYFINGDTLLADRRFQQAIKLNKYFVPAYVGSGLSKLKSGLKDDAATMFEAAIANADEYAALNHETAVLPMIIKAKYLAMLAQERPDRVITTLAAETDREGFIDAIEIIADYLLQPQLSKLDPIRESSIYKMKDLVYLFDLSERPMQEVKELPFKNRNTIMSAKYIMAKRSRNFDETYLAPYLTERVVLTDLTNLSTLLRKRPEGLRYLQMLNQFDVAYPAQYKASFYYFMWTRDFINSEAAYATLERLSYTDKEMQYYLMLYFLINNDNKRLTPQVAQYNASYENDYKGILMDAMRNLEDRNVDGFFDQMELLLDIEPFVFNKMPVEIDIERF